MAKFVRFNVACRVDGEPYAIGQQVIIDDIHFLQLSRMTRRRQCYITEIELPTASNSFAEEDAAEKPKRKNKKRKEKADLPTPESAD